MDLFFEGGKYRELMDYEHFEAGRKQGARFCTKLRFPRTVQDHRTPLDDTVWLIFCDFPADGEIGNTAAVAVFDLGQRLIRKSIHH